MVHVIMMCGVCGSGKTTYARQNNSPFVITEEIWNNYYNDFEYDVVMIQTLANYPSDKTIKVLKNALSSYNYHVRYNAGKSLSRMTNLTKITGLTDPFAKDMIEAFISQEV